MANDKIVIHGARAHNLKNIDVTIPRDKLVICDRFVWFRKRALWRLIPFMQKDSGGYVESLSAYARQFLGQMDKPDVIESMD